jgi:hypothetical protein
MVRTTSKDEFEFAAYIVVRGTSRSADRSINAREPCGLD